MFSQYTQKLPVDSNIHKNFNNISHCMFTSLYYGKDTIDSRIQRERERERERDREGDRERANCNYH